MPPRKRATLNSVSRLGLREHGAETRQKTSYAAPISKIIQLHPQTFRRALTIATEAESENNKVTKNKTANNIEVVDITDGQHIHNEVQRLYTIIQEQDRRI